LACAQEGIDDGARAVELVKLGGPCSHTPGAHIATHVHSRLPQAGVDVGVLEAIVHNTRVFVQYNHDHRPEDERWRVFRRLWRRP